MGSLITELFSNFSTAISGVGDGLKTAIKTLIYEDPTASELVVSDLAKFGFMMLGVSMAIGIVYLIFRLIRR